MGLTTSKHLLFTALLALLLLDRADVSTDVLSRHKRYLVFPEGSSLQLVYELAIATVHRRPYVMSYTAGTAWELPGDASHIVEKFKPFKVRTEPPPPPQSTTKPPDHHFYYHDWDYDEHQAMEAPMMNGGSGKQKGAGSKVFHETYNKKHPHRYKEYYRGYSGYSRPQEVRLHRHHRRSAFLKLEPLLLTVGLGGRACVLRALCEAGQRRPDGSKDSFLSELLHVLFTLPPDEENEEVMEEEQNDVLHHYDTAHSAIGACDDLYPECTTSLFQLWAPNSSI